MASETPVAHFPDLARGRTVVTGTSDGIGLAVAEALLAAGGDVVGLDVRPAPAALSAAGARYRHQLCDLRDAVALAATFADVQAHGPTLDGLVNCAGIDPFYAVDEAGAAEWAHVLDLDLRAYYLAVHHALPLLRAGGRKSIVNISSINYRLGVPRRALYTTAKNAIIGLTRGLARELGRDGIRVNTVSPGWVFTERQRQAYFEGPDAAKHLETIARTQAIGLHIQPEDIAVHVLFYLSNASRASTGHNCVVDGGWLLD